MSSNQLSGHINISSLSSLRHLVLHRNRLSGPVPATQTKLELVSLFDNRLEGSVPPFSQPRWLLLFNNLLSCSLPEHMMPNTPVTNDDLVTLVAPGNNFYLVNWFGPISAQWLYKWDKRSSHLFELRWFRETWILVACASAGVIMGWLSCRRTIRSASAHLLPPLWYRCRKVCVMLSAFATVFAVVLAALPQIRLCASAIDRPTLAETRISVPVAAVLGTFVCLHFVCSVASTVWLAQARVIHGKFASQYGNCKKIAMRRVLVILVWTVCILILHVPTVLELVMSSFPTNNAWGVHRFVVAVSLRLMSVWLVVSSEVLIPRLSEWCTRQYYPDVLVSDAITTNPDHESDIAVGLFDRASHQFQSRVKSVKTTTTMIMASQLIVLAVAPILSQLLTGDRCLAVTRKFWDPCVGNTTGFNITIEFTTVDVGPGAVCEISDWVDIVAQHFEGFVSNGLGACASIDDSVVQGAVSTVERTRWQVGPIVY
eukprot:c8408_g1_i2.p1 GENE.c8408_g1_i2~~c8408_g1_i2.p1  ORF type:complete len:547 (+),score=73.13 c8408_g1_i2:188-1642(+)